MNLVLFIHQDSSKKGKALKTAIKNNVGGGESLTFQTVNKLESRLKKTSSTEKEILILLAESKTRLDELTSLIYLLENKRIILILPDDSKETISKASQFFPRFFTPISCKYDDLCSVINKMMGQEIINNNIKGGDDNGRTC